MYNVWFYTFSTCAQVLAALVGLFAVFVVYKIQSISSVYDDIRGAVVKLISDYISLPNYQSGEFVGKLEEIFFWSDEKLEKTFNFLKEKHKILKTEEQVWSNAGTAPILIFNYQLDDRTYKIFKSLVSRNKGILHDLLQVLIVALISIAFTIFCLSFPTLINYSLWAIYINYGLVIINLLLIGYKTFYISAI